MIDFKCMEAGERDRMERARRIKMPTKIEAHVCYALHAATFLAALDD